jgi:preprotein translocase subunit SecG
MLLILLLLLVVVVVVVVAAVAVAVVVQVQFASGLNGLLSDTDEPHVALTRHGPRSVMLFSEVFRSGFFLALSVCLPLSLTHRQTDTLPHRISHWLASQ